MFLFSVHFEFLFGVFFKRFWRFNLFLHHVNDSAQSSTKQLNLLLLFQLKFRIDAIMCDRIPVYLSSNCAFLRLRRNADVHIVFSKFESKMYNRRRRKLTILPLRFGWKAALRLWISRALSLPPNIFSRKSLNSENYLNQTPYQSQAMIPRLSPRLQNSTKS